MLTEMKALFQRSSSRLLADMAGGLALAVMLLVGLHLPAMI